jgi:tRNA(Ile2) C34 agmatinyltransferase TiaS
MDNREKKRRTERMKKQEKWLESFGEASEAVSEWRAEHRRATFNEIENRVDGNLAKIRAEMIEDLVRESQLTNIKEMAREKRPRCPVCGQVLASNGRQKRQLISSHEQVIEIERSKGYCRRCRVSFFPPG